MLLQGLVRQAGEVLRDQLDLLPVIQHLVERLDVVQRGLQHAPRSVCAPTLGPAVEQRRRPRERVRPSGWHVVGGSCRTPPPRHCTGWSLARSCVQIAQLMSVPQHMGDLIFP